MAQDPCPELCDPNNTDKYIDDKSVWLKNKKSAMKKLTQNKVIKNVKHCDSCHKNDSICYPIGNQSFSCVGQELLTGFDNPCEELCLMNGFKCRIMGHKCIEIEDPNEYTESFDENYSNYPSTIASNRLKLDKKIESNCTSCFKNKMSCIRLQNQTSCVPDKLVNNQDCMDLCPHVKGLTQSCHNKTYLKHKEIVCFATKRDQDCSKCSKGCIEIQGYQNVCSKVMYIYNTGYL